MNGHEKKFSHDNQTEEKIRLGKCTKLLCRNKTVDANPDLRPWADAVKFSMHARGDRDQINSLRILAQIIRPTRIHHTFVGDELTTTFGLVFCG